MEAMSKGFGKSFDAKLVEDELMNEELELAQNLRSRYVSREWLRRR